MDSSLFNLLLGVFFAGVLLGASIGPLARWLMTPGKKRAAKRETPRKRRPRRRW